MYATSEVSAIITGVEDQKWPENNAFVANNNREEEKSR